MSYLKDGRLIFTKKEVKSLELLVEHSRKDMYYGGDGTFYTGKMNKDGDYASDFKAIREVSSACELVEWIIKSLDA